MTSSTLTRSRTQRKRAKCQLTDEQRAEKRATERERMERAIEELRSKTIQARRLHQQQTRRRGAGVMTLNQQLDLNGGRHDIAPAHETVKLFDSAPQIRGQVALDTDWCDAAACPASACVECQQQPRVWKRDESLVFTPHGETDERSGQFWSDEQGCGVVVFGWADGRKYLVGHQDIRPETEHERCQREEQGYYVEDLRRQAARAAAQVEPSESRSELETARSFYVHRFAPDGHEGWTGSLRPLARALREAQAWIDCGWTAEVLPNTLAVRRDVRLWNQLAQERRMAGAS